MRHSSASRRTQFSSCDACRQSRVACDASKLGHRPDQTRWSGSCSRCSERNRRCTFEWIKKSPARLRQDSKARSLPNAAGSLNSCETPDQSALAIGGEPSITREETDKADSTHAPSSEIFVLESEPKLSDAPSSDAESVDVLLTQWGEQIFHHGFGTIFGHLVGRNGCPFVNDPMSDISIAPMKLFRELDGCMDKRDGDPGSVAQTEERNRQIEDSLRRAIQSFVARWLPAVMQETPSGPIQYDEIIKERWRVSRRDMLKVINRTSYRSVLTLYLFGQTPVPSGISEKEEMDGINGLVCAQTALLQLQQLRERLRNCPITDSVSGFSDTRMSAAACSNLTQAFLDLESRAYWAAVVWDTSSSVTLNIRSSLTSGLKGACLEPAWRLTRGFLVGAFHARSEDWRKKGFEIFDEIAPQIISAAAVCSTYTWRTIASVKEALREGVEESDVIFSWNAFLDALDVFRTTINPLLTSCERRLHFLGQRERLNWYEVVLHYHLGIVILADAVEAANRLDLLSQISETRLEAEQESFNVLKFGLESNYTIQGPRDESYGTSEANLFSSSPGQSVITSFVALDPYPHHVVTSLRLMQKAISRRYRQGNIKHEAYAYLSSTLLKVLEQLPQNSKIIQSARENLQESLELGTVPASCT